MSLTELSVRNPAGVVVAVLLACFLGIYAFVKLPVQLFPDVEEPALTITTNWRAVLLPRSKRRLSSRRNKRCAAPLA